LQLIVESSNRLLDKRELTAYCDAALTEVALLLGVDPEGVVCARVDQLNADNESADSPHKAIIVGAAGRLRAFIGRGVDSLPDSSVAAALRLAIRARANIEADDATTLFFPQESSGADFVIYLPTSRTLQETERQLLRVFATNISGGLHNVALFSRLDRLAYVDPLLGLPNKNALVRAIDHGLQTEGKSDLILLIVDLDQFSDANHSFGVR
jgi:hypothetical protein